jgi:hemerythrin-like domain-containing protein
LKSTEHWLVHDHTQIEGILTDLRKEAEILDWWALGRYLEQLIEHLSYHMAQEEEIIFTAYDKKCEPSDTQTAELRDQHEQLFECVQDIRRLINNKAKDQIVDRIEDLIALQVEHGNREEKVFLPFASHLLYEERDELAEKLENFKITISSRAW